VKILFGLFLVIVAPVLLGAACDTPGLPGVPTGPIGSTISTATQLKLDAAGKVNIASSLSGAKVDVYDLGEVGPGDRLIISVKPTAGSRLDPTIAVFDQNEELFALNDDVNLAAGQLDSAVDEAVTVAASHLYLAVAKFFFDNQGGTYEGNVEIQRGVGIAMPAPQMLWLNFAGGAVTIPGEGSYTLDVFDSADIDAAYAGQTAVIKAKIIEIVRSNFRNTGLIITTSDEVAAPVDPFSTLHFGAYSGTKFGVAESVDQGNRDRCDDGIIYTDDFDKPFAPMPSTEGIGVAIGNVAAHEAGHLLGLSHVADVTALMDTTGSASTLLADQEFKTAVLSNTVFPFGKQNDMALLLRVVPIP
jgi:hypothetical protein